MKTKLIWLAIIMLALAQLLNFAWNFVLHADTLRRLNLIEAQLGL